MNLSYMWQTSDFRTDFTKVVSNPMFAPHPLSLVTVQTKAVLYLTFLHFCSVSGRDTPCVMVSDTFLARVKTQPQACLPGASALWCYQMLSHRLCIQLFYLLMLIFYFSFGHVYRECLLFYVFFFLTFIAD